MKIGIPKEIKNNENRVGMTPSGVYELIQHGHTVYVQATAGEGSGFSDADYQQVGAEILPSIADVYAASEMIIKVKEPIEPEYALVRPGQLLFTYFHFASDRELTEAMVKSGAVCLAYETVETPDRRLPLLIPMSEVAGRMAAMCGAYYLQKTKGGKGKLISGVPGVKPAKVLVLGGGTVGEASARLAAGLGADVYIYDISLPRLRQLGMELPANVHPLYSSPHNIITEVASRPPIPPRTTIPSTPSTASSTMPWPTCRVPCPTPRRRPSATPRCAMPSPWPTRAGGRPARTTTPFSSDSMSSTARSPISLSPRHGTWSMSRSSCKP